MGTSACLAISARLTGVGEFSKSRAAALMRCLRLRSVSLRMVAVPGVSAVIHPDRVTEVAPTVDASTSGCW